MSLLPVLILTPHAGGTLDAARPYYRDETAIQDELPARFEDWYEGGAEVAAEALSKALGAPLWKPTLPRDLVDLGRPLLRDPPDKETLFTKSAVDAWTRPKLRPGAYESLVAYYYGSLAEVRALTRSARVVIEVHEYGKKGSSYDQAGKERRPMERPECAVVRGGPWRSSDCGVLNGIERLLPASLDGTTWPVEFAAVRSLTQSFVPGPNPYPQRTPWSVTSRFIAERYFTWAGQNGLLPASTAAHLADLAWGDPFDPSLDTLLSGQGEPADLAGIGELGRRLSDWDADEGSIWAGRFAREAGSVTLALELRNDLRSRAPEFGTLLATGVRRFLEGP